MIEEVLLQSNGSASSIINLLGVTLLLAVGYFHYIASETDDDDVAGQAKKRGAAVLFGFAVYALVVGTFGGTETWVGQLGLAIDSYFERFAEQLLIAGEQSEESSRIDSLLNTIRTIGLATYIIVFTSVAYSVRAPIRLYEAVVGN